MDRLEHLKSLLLKILCHILVLVTLVITITYLVGIYNGLFWLCHNFNFNNFIGTLVLGSLFTVLVALMVFAGFYLFYAMYGNVNDYDENFFSLIRMRKSTENLEEEDYETV